MYASKKRLVIPIIMFSFFNAIISYADVIPEVTLDDAIKEPAGLYSQTSPSLLTMSVKTVVEAGNNCIVGDYKACTFQFR